MPISFGLEAYQFKNSSPIWLLNSDSYLDVVIGAANEGEDSDTIAAIAGGIAGLACGYESLPKDYCEVLEVREELAQLAIKLNNSLGGY